MTCSKEIKSQNARNRTIRWAPPNFRAFPLVPCGCPSYAVVPSHRNSFSGMVSGGREVLVPTKNLKTQENRHEMHLKSFSGMVSEEKRHGTNEKPRNLTKTPKENPNPRQPSRKQRRSCAQAFRREPQLIRHLHLGAAQRDLTATRCDAPSAPEAKGWRKGSEEWVVFLRLEPAKRVYFLGEIPQKWWLFHLVSLQKPQKQGYSQEKTRPNVYGIGSQGIYDVLCSLRGSKRS